MSWFSRLFAEFIDVIEWTDDSSDTMVYRFERYGNEIKYGAKLIVRESQMAVFVNEGQVADILGPGTYELETKNLPVLTTLQHWHHGFRSPFKAEVYFCNMRRFTDLKWGTKQPLMLRDAEFGPVRIRSFGTYSVRIGDPMEFIREIVGTDGVFTTDEISNQLRNLITSRFAAIVAGSGIPVLDMAANYDQFGEFLTTRIAPEFGEYGLELARLLVENISLPPAVSEALDKRTSMGLTGDLDRYLKYQTGSAMEQAAANPAGGASEGIGLGMGMAMANRMAENAMGAPSSRAAGASAAHGAPGSPGTGHLANPGSAQPAHVSDQSAAVVGSVPPPLPTTQKYHVAAGDTATGPFGIDELATQAAAGSLSRETLVWSAGFGDWRAAGDVPMLEALFTHSGPPPIPPAKSSP